MRDLETWQQDGEERLIYIETRQQEGEERLIEMRQQEGEERLRDAATRRRGETQRRGNMQTVFIVYFTYISTFHYT